MPGENPSASVGAQARVIALVERLPVSHPMLVRVAAVGLALAGYALPLFFPLAAMAVFIRVAGSVVEGGVIAFAESWIALAGFGLCALMTASLWRLQILEPSGEPIDACQSPGLFEQVGVLREAFQTPPIHDIHLTEAAEVEICRVPRNGFPFLVRQVLLIGLPTLQCLSPEQFKCLLATRFGELSAVRADLAGWVDQVAGTWRLLALSVAGRRAPAALLYRGFIAGYLPLLVGLERRLSSGRRFRRDHYALEVASDDLVAELFAGEIVMKRFLDEHYWPTVHRAAEHSPDPNFKVFRNLEPVFQNHVSDDRVQIWLREAYVGKWRANECDPDLRARLHEIGHGELSYRRPSGASAAQALLGASHQWIIDRCDARWAVEHETEWRERHQKNQRRHERLASLRQKLQENGLQGEEAMEYATLVKRYGSAGEALDTYRAILESNPDDAKINFGVGKFLLSCGETQGVKVLERAMELDKRYVDPACRLISAFNSGQRRQAARAAIHAS